MLAKTRSNLNLSTGEIIAICRPFCIVSEPSQIEECYNLPFTDEEKKWLPCIKLLKEHRRCDYVQANYDESAEKYLRYINYFESSFKELGSSKEHSVIYKLRKQGYWSNE